MKDLALLAAIALPASARVVPALAPSSLEAVSMDAGATCDGQGVELLQLSTQASKAQDPEKMLEKLGNYILPDPAKDFNCSATPTLCQEPFKCDTVDLRSIGKEATQPHENIKTWCLSPEYSDFITQCLAEKDLVKAAHTQYNLTKQGVFGGKETFELDGSYCFIEGHCLNTAVTKDTTLEAARLMCDERYGRETWTSIMPRIEESGERRSWYKNMSKFLLTGGSRPGFTGQSETRGFLLTACAMGNYHCDIVMCQETYCKDPEMKEKYGHFLEDNGWTKSNATWLVGKSS